MNEERKVSAAKRASNDKWDAEHMAYQTVKVRRELLEEFRVACKLRGDPVNAVLRRAMEDYVEQAKNAPGQQAADEQGEDKGQV